MTACWSTTRCASTDVASQHVAELDWDGDPVALEVGLRARLSAAGRGSQLGVEVQQRFRLGDGGVDDREALLWWPSRPVLLDAEVTLLDAAGDVLDEARSYTALRHVGCEDGAFLLNGRPLPLRLVLDQGYWPHTGATPPDAAALRTDLALTRALGFQGARKHQKTEDPRYLAWADRLGMLVWAETPSAYRPGPTSARRLLAEWPEVVRAHAATHRWSHGSRSTSPGASRRWRATPCIGHCWAPLTASPAPWTAAGQYR